MWRRKWLILAVLLPTLVVGGLAGVAAAADDTGDESQAETRYEAMLDRVCAIYEGSTGVAIDPEQLGDAFAQARSEMQDEALENWLEDMVAQGEITQEQADEYLGWWGAKPDTPLAEPFGRGFGCRGFRGGPWAPPEASGS